MSILDELYNGILEPFDKCFDGNSKYAKLTHTVANTEEKLMDRLDSEGKILLEKLLDAQKEIDDINEKERFIQGYRLCARLVRDAF